MTPTNNEPQPNGRYQYFNRELSWLAFNRRVLDQAFSEKYPLLERIRFLSFVSSNLDQFYEIRVAGLLQQVDAASTEADFDGIGPRELLERVRVAGVELVKDKYRCWRETLLPELERERVHFKSVDELTPREFKWLASYFRREVHPVLTPLAIDPSHPFPLITNKSLNLIVSLKNPNPKRKEPLIAVVPVPRILPRLVRVDPHPRKPATFLFLSDVVRRFASRLFPGYKLLGAWAFRITRNSDLYIDEEEVENLLTKIEEELYNLRKGSAVRLEIEESVDEDILRYLLEAIHLAEVDVHRIDGPLNLYRLRALPEQLDRPDLKFEPYAPKSPKPLQTADSIFSAVSRTDYLLHHPYESFAPVVEFVRQAANDPDVFAIKQTLYRTSEDSPILKALMDAARNGKQVTAMVELKARFDEAANIQWARQMEEMGVHVVYGLSGLKTHCKCCLVVRREKRGLKRYAHLGTGNYNHHTARLYTDFSFFTANPDLTADVANLFNSLTGFSRSPKFRKLLVAPFNLHGRLIELVDREAANARAGKKARIIVKVNSLIDKETIDALYGASSAGVKVDLIVRGICGLVPGVKGLSENIRIRSILGRYLEHSRIFYFENVDEEPVILVGSADWMPRNFFRRIEAIFPIENPAMKERLQEILKTYLRDNEFAKALRPNGSYASLPMRKDKEPFSAQRNMAETARSAQTAK
jgi:polyphosphate kinase